MADNPALEDKIQPTLDSYFEVVLTQLPSSFQPGMFQFLVVVAGGVGVFLLAVTASSLLTVSIGGLPAFVALFVLSVGRGGGFVFIFSW